MAATPPPSAHQGLRFDLRTHGVVEPAHAEQARHAITAVVTAHHEATGPVRLRISGGHVAGGTTLVQVNLRVRDEPARIQITGPIPQAAIDAAADRLEHQIRRLNLGMDLTAAPDPVRRLLDIPGHAPIARLKTVRLHATTPAHAAAHLTAMDYEAHLFTDTDTDEDAVVYRAGPAGLRLARQHSKRPPSTPITHPLTVNSRQTPTLNTTDAAHRLADAWLPFIFYTDRDTGRGNLLYRRYDSNLGLISPLLPNPQDPPNPKQ
ncbi:HPF/RaiA family ribosome-associated protein [Catellatospora chokoriensis]|uniref:Dormancy associated translation inhibitor n=1 Tax=Catellatospora chokoriensis TaxID=310353 RepID=A0A8J3K160_9ACTN|nr:HPF/RaiA family ribosome-associated protein [Catellatospora chokoriensis]GIF94821.1 dormancy associated translation inhibitor [Catellatospora chokoriensis]